MLGFRDLVHTGHLEYFAKPRSDNDGPLAPADLLTDESALAWRDLGRYTLFTFEM